MTPSGWQETLLQLLDANELKEQSKLFFTLLVSNLIDVAFLILWAVIQAVAGIIIESFELVGIDRWMLETFRVIFAIITLIPVIVYVSRNIAMGIAKVMDNIWRVRELERRSEE